ncbi:hypothetical protein RJ640_006793 [Escallonia rubra]|uniref:Scarecrow-like protein 6 n=2 Tax=Escallonia rubra TaxID=112253 RepID=A0AA88S0K4_9ASTE|nr:hypothetical protein RJ640_006793 [Escallonia rubra]
MKGMPLPLDFEVKGVLSNLLVQQHKWNKQGCFVGCTAEPTSVLDSLRSPSPPTSTSTLSSSFGGGGGGSVSPDAAGLAAVSGNPSQKWPPVHQETTSSNAGAESSLEILRPLPPPSLEIGGSGSGNPEKCGLGMDDWESVLSDSVAASPGQEQSILRWIMGDVEDPYMGLGLNKVLQIGSGTTTAPDFEFNGGFGVVDQGFDLDPVSSGGTMNPSFLPSGFPHKFNHEKLGLSPNPPNFKLANPHNQTPMFSPLSSNNLPPISLPNQAPFDDVKPHIFNPHLLINQYQAHQAQNPAFFLDQQHLMVPPQAKRHNPGNLEGGCPVQKGPFLDSGQQQSFQGLPHQLQLLPPYMQPRPAAMAAKPKIVGDESGMQQQQGIIDQLYKAADLVQSGNLILAQGILARLNHQLFPIGKPFHRAAYYFKEALQQLLLHTGNDMNPPSIASSLHSSPFSLVFKIGAYKSFSEISPLIQFANFTCNQALLEVLDSFDRIHIIDFDIGYGGQWASLMQELALRGGGAPSLKITAFASPSTHDQLELGLTRENLNHFAGELNMAFEFEILNLDALNSASWSLPIHVSENEATAVNLPVGSFSGYQVSLPLVLRFIKQLSPKIVVSMDRGWDRTDLPFPNHVIHALQSYSNLLESLDAVNVNLDALQKIERFLLQPGIEKIVMDRHRSPDKTQHWRTLFLSSGFSPLTFSNFTESQAECVVKRTPVRGFHVEKRQSSLVLCWQRRELVSASAWRWLFPLPTLNFDDILDMARNWKWTTGGERIFLCTTLL